MYENKNINALNKLLTKSNILELPEIFENTNILTAIGCAEPVDSLDDDFTNLVYDYLGKSIANLAFNFSDKDVKVISYNPQGGMNTSVVNPCQLNLNSILVDDADLLIGDVPTSLNKSFKKEAKRLLIGEGLDNYLEKSCDYLGKSIANLAFNFSDENLKINDAYYQEGMNTSVFNPCHLNLTSTLVDDANLPIGDVPTSLNKSFKKEAKRLLIGEGLDDYLEKSYDYLGKSIANLAFNCSDEDVNINTFDSQGKMNASFIVNPYQFDLTSESPFEEILVGDVNLSIGDVPTSLDKSFKKEAKHLLIGEILNDGLEDKRKHYIEQRAKYIRSVGPEDSLIRQMKAGEMSFLSRLENEREKVISCFDPESTLSIQEGLNYVLEMVMSGEEPSSGRAR